MLLNDNVSMEGFNLWDGGFPGHVLHRAVNNQDVIKKSDGHRNVVITYFQLCKVRSFYVIDCTN